MDWIISIVHNGGREVIDEGIVFDNEFAATDDKGVARDRIGCARKPTVESQNDM